MDSSEPESLTWARELLAVARTGDRYAGAPYDRERYEQVAAIARRMLAGATGLDASRFEGLELDTGYATPKIDVRGAVIEAGRILLLRERSDGLWTLPGGFAAGILGGTANVVKEVGEESGLRVQVDRLYAVVHRSAYGYAPNLRDFCRYCYPCRRVSGVPRPELPTF